MLTLAVPLESNFPTSSSFSIWHLAHAILTMNSTTCVICHRSKQLNAFSLKSHNELRSRMASGEIKDLQAARGEHIRCTQCSSTRRNELQCALCDRWMPLEGFSKAARTRGDDAVITAPPPSLGALLTRHSAASIAPSLSRIAQRYLYRKS